MQRFNLIVFLFVLISCAASPEKEPQTFQPSANNEDSSLVKEIEDPLYCNDKVKVGAERLDEYVSLLEGKKIGVVGNQSSLIGDIHLVDTLMSLGIEIKKVFSPEHGFRGKADAGEHVNNEVDQKTGLPIISLYGNNKKPKKEQLSGLDVLVFDIQDVGVRFYTYISTLHYVMEAAAEQGIQVVVLDRPNPNGHYVDGPILKDGYTSFVGMHQVPVVHGMTVGEYAQMVNGEFWLADSIQCDLTVVACEGWDHTKFYELPIAPSPNLPNMMSVYLYPQLCFFEGTVVSIGRGTDFPFQIIGHPGYESEFSFVPQPNEGAGHPKLEGETCFGIDLHQEDLRELRSKGTLNLTYMIDFYSQLGMGEDFFLSNNFINLLAGSDQLKKQLIKGVSEEDIKATWEGDLELFKQLRSDYLLYKE